MAGMSGCRGYSAGDQRAKQEQMKRYSHMMTANNPAGELPANT
jgi:hypothetical protein